MNYTRTTILLAVCWVSVICLILTPFALAQVTKVDSAITDTISKTDSRKSFGYCPVTSDTQIVLNKYGAVYDIESCPLARIYIDNWTSLDDNTKQQIVIELASIGYQMEKE